MNKTHLPVLNIGTNVATACGRGKARAHTTVRQVNCLLCQETDTYARAFIADKAERLAAFEAQTPRRLREPWLNGDVTMVCRECGSQEFRIGSRTLFDQSYVCVNGHKESRLTETGMST